jgi:small subunit ribosomal protein S4
MKYQKRKFEKPVKSWDKTRIDEEKKIMQSYGLRRKKELWRAESILRDYRRLARVLSARKDKDKEKILIDKLFKMGLIGKEADLDDVLALTIDNIMNRRIQTLVVKKGMAKTPKEARQYIVHGHISFEGRRVKWPSMLVHLGGEEMISFYEKSKIGVKS